MGTINYRHTPLFDPEDALTSAELLFIQQLAADANNDPDSLPIISTGTSVPGSTPATVGDIFVDTVNLKIYIASGTASSSDWTEVTGGGGGGGMTVETPTGTVNGANTAFTVVNVPKFIVTDTGIYIEGFGYSRSGGNITMSLAPNNFIRAYS